MRFAPKRLSRHGKPYLNTATAICGMVLFCAALISSPIHAQPERTVTSGIAWNVQGEWHTLGVRAAIHTGDPIWPNALIQPDTSVSAHSIEVLLPDGQSILYQCFTRADCARGFRVPALFRAPDPFALQMLQSIRAALSEEQSKNASALAAPSRGVREEAVVALGPEHRIHIVDLAAKLSNGDYFGDLQSIEDRYPEQSRIALHQSGPSIDLTVPGPGLYVLNITDSRNWQRINIMIAVVSAPDSRIAKDFQREHTLLATWTHRDFFGWPVHDFQRAYLESLMLHLPTAPGSHPKAAIANSPRAGVTAEPDFFPRPGVVSGNMNITLRCVTPGATIHYMLGASQPLESSPIASSPIFMTTLPMTIKAFASAPGKKDSPVVTANFRVDSD